MSNLSCDCCGHDKPLNQPNWVCSENGRFCSVACATYHGDGACHHFLSDDDMDPCGNCGGEGYVHDCIDGFCRDAEEGCDLCTQPCDWCNRSKK